LQHYPSIRITRVYDAERIGGNYYSRKGVKKPQNAQRYKNMSATRMKARIILDGALDSGF